MYTSDLLFYFISMYTYALLIVHRPNIKLNIKRANHFQAELQWYIDFLRAEGGKSTESYHLGRAKRICFLSPMRAAKVQASLRIRAVSPEPPLLAHTSSESKGTFRQKARSLVPLNGWACAIKICHDGMLEDTKLLDSAHLLPVKVNLWLFFYF